MTKRLVFYNNLRTYLEGSVLQMADGNFSEAVTAPGTVAYLRQKLKQTELEEYTAKKEWIYSDPYYDSDSGNDTRKFVMRSQCMTNAVTVI